MPGILQIKCNCNQHFISLLFCNEHSPTSGADNLLRFTRQTENLPAIGALRVLISDPVWNKVYAPQSYIMPTDYTITVKKMDCPKNCQWRGKG